MKWALGRQDEIPNPKHGIILTNDGDIGCCGRKQWAVLRRARIGMDEALCNIELASGRGMVQCLAVFADLGGGRFTKGIW